MTGIFGFNAEDSERIGRSVVDFERRPEDSFNTARQAGFDFEDPIFVRITATGASDGLYKGIEVFWNPSADTPGWEDLDNGILWEAVDSEDSDTSSNAGEIQNSLETETEAYIDVIFVAYLAYKDDGAGTWFFLTESNLLLPFFLTYDEDTGIATVGGLRDEADYRFEDSISMGTQRIAKPNKETVAAAADTNGVVYYIINIATFTATLAFAASLPADTATKRHIVVGEIRDNKAFQVLYGYINLDLGEVQVSQNDTTLGYLEDKIGTPTEFGAPPDPIQENLFLFKFTSGEAVNETQEIDGDIGLLDALSGSPDGTELVMVKEGVLTGAHRQMTTEEIADLGGDGKVFVSADDTTKDFLDIKIITPTDLGDAASSEPANKAVMSFVAPNGGANERLKLDFDIARTQADEVSPDTVNAGFQYTDDITTNGATHNKVLFDSLAGDHILFSTGQFNHEVPGAEEVNVSWLEGIEGTDPSQYSKVTMSLDEFGHVRSIKGVVLPVPP